MGAVIEKFAFFPPDRAESRRLLEGKRNVLYTKRLKKNDHDICMIYFSHGGGKPRTTLLFSHGNAEDLAVDYSMLEGWSQHYGVDVLAYDYTGYGASGGEKPTEADVYVDVKTCLEYALKDLNIPRKDIIIVGRSLGSGPSCDIASKEKGLGGLALISPLSSCAQVGAGNAGYYGAYAFDVFPNFRKIGKVRDFPVHIFHGDKDEVVPFSHGEELFKECAKKNPAVTHTWLPGAGHNDIEYKQGRMFHNEFVKFIKFCQGYSYDPDWNKKNQGEGKISSSRSLSSTSCIGSSCGDDVAERKGTTTTSSNSDSTF